MILPGDESFIMVARLESVQFFRLYYQFFGSSLQSSYIEAAQRLQGQVGKVQKQPSHRSVVRHRTPYERKTPSRTSGVETVDESTNSSTSSFLAEYPCRSAIEDCDDNARGAMTPGDGSEGRFQRELEPERLPAAEVRARIRRSPSVSSSGCSSSMEDRNCDFSPLGDANSCRCSSLSISDFDDDGFREDATVSSLYSVFSGHSRTHQVLQQQNPHRNPNNTKGLFDIALKTVKLIRRNQELQKRLAQLQQETKAFIESVMANPENESLRSHYQTSANVTSSVIVQK
ncbi:uncharacterized protein LOC129757933 isoform X2 [Uranotaenia lowii]|uniref:uncharacterized protein LOC129757933 isoform X2 n=1 Tax=Uranotaenia lowii TaxID=190385 RepID=UPI00247AAFC4|nr:uncharacterized protein LOC129757933 isoform X2 [Uranotaenia lowii]